MANFKRADLRFSYSWTAAKEGDNKRITGFPDNYLIDRDEGYEVLPYINRFMASHNYVQIASFHKIETAIKTQLPGNVRGHATIKRWLEQNITF